jgi:TatD DNase family protein
VNPAVTWDDSHCHLDPDTAGDRVAEARAAGVDRIVNVGTDVDDSSTAIETARRFDGVWATAGVHPHEASRGLDGLDRLLAEPEVVAVGECGLDYHYDHSPRAAQRDVFAAQVRLAHSHGLALVIHTREAWDDTFAILEAEGVPDRTVFHCFSGGPGEAVRAVELGAVLSFSGIVTFKNAADVRRAVGSAPLDRILVETDSPYLAPVPHRGRPNRPVWVAEVGRAVAAIKQLAEAELAGALRDNAERVFRFRR